MIRERIQHIHYSSKKNAIIASGRRGGIYLLDLELNVIQSSPVTEYNNPVTKIAANEQYIFTKDNIGNIVRWDIDTLIPIDVLVSGEYRDDSQLDEEDSVTPSVNHALTLFENKLYVSNGYGQILELDTENFKILRVMDPNKESFIESFEFSNPDFHVFSDFRGWLFTGNIKTGEFKKTTRVDFGPVHHVRYDSRHNRFWCSTDNNSGFAIVDGEGNNPKYYKMTNDDVEWIDFNEDATIAYVACFDHHLYIYSNLNEEITLKKVVGPFKFQLKQVCYVNQDQIYVLLESGEFYCLSKDGIITHTSPYSGNSVWGLDALPGNDSVVYCALEDGSVSIVEYKTGNYNSVEIDELSRHKFSFGRVRRAKPLPDGSYIAITTSGTIFKADQDGSIQWYTKVLGICRDIDINPNYTKAIIGTESNYAVELSVDRGGILRDFQLEAPIWTVCYDSRSNVLLGMRRKNIEVYHSERMEIISKIEVADNIKRSRLLANGNILLNGPEGVVEVDTISWQVIKRWNEWITSTCENALVIEDMLYAITYSMFLNSYRYDNSELVDYQISVNDFPKGIVARKDSNGTKLLMVGGRGPYLSVFRLEDGIPHKVRDIFL